MCFFCSNASIFLDFGYDWYFMISLSKFLSKKKYVKIVFYIEMQKIGSWHYPNDLHWYKLQFKKITDTKKILIFHLLLLKTFIYLFIYFIVNNLASDIFNLIKN